MKKSLPILSSFLVILLISSCATTVYVTKEYSPEIVVNGNPKTIVLINNFNYSNPDIVKYKEQGTYARAIGEFLKGAMTVLSSDDSLKVIVADTIRTYTEPGMLTALLPADTVADICNRYGACMLISLDSVTLGFYSDVYYLETIEYLNIYSRTFHFFSEFFLSSYKSSGELVVRSTVDKDAVYSWRPALTDFVAFNPSLHAAERKIGKLAFPCGKEYASRFYPYRETIAREVYNGIYFTESNNLMKSGRWEEAISILEELSKSHDKQISKNALNNLQVAKEGYRH